MTERASVDDILGRLIEGWCERRVLRPLALLLPVYLDRHSSPGAGAELLKAIRAIRALGQPPLLEGELVALNDAFALLLHGVVEEDGLTRE